MGYKPIADYAIVGNMTTAALVARDGSIDWCCLPRFSSPSIFAAVLDDEKGGQFQIRPQGPFDTMQQYLPDTNILQTTFTTPEGTVALLDFMPCYKDSAGGLALPHQIHRLLSSDKGAVDMEVVFRPKLDYAMGDTTLEISTHGVTARDKDTVVTLSSGRPFVLRGDTAVSHFTLKEGEQSTFILSQGSLRPLPPAAYRSTARLEKTTAYWQELAAECACNGTWREAIVRSYLTLHLLVYHHTGAMIAAATTSLPENIGGERNWDYRFSWLRDASLIIDAFTRLRHTEEAVRHMAWLLKVCAERGPRGQTLFGIEQTDSLDERTLDHMSGYRDSRPVRIGNGAYQQRQLDVFGEVLEAAYNYTRIGGYTSKSMWSLMEDYVDSAVKLWKEPDQGIWEVRGGPFHFVHSKMMCWVAVDRGIRLAEELGYGKSHLKEWRRTAEAIREDILAKGWNAERQSFTQHYETSALDASTLLMPLVGFLPATDEQMKATIEHTASDLDMDGLLRRYRTDETDDGLKGSEGAFLWCSFWMVRDLIRLDRVDEARALYERLLGYRNHVGLFSEMVDPTTGDSLGNVPQALSHLAVIVAGLELTEALQTLT